MHIVYKLVFQKRKDEEIVPHTYIGSKSNSKIINGIIYDKVGKQYFGSSKCKLMSDALKNEIPFAEIMFESENYDEVLQFERDVHIEFNVVSSIEYFNKSIATQSTFHKSGYGTYKHHKTGKIIRLKTDDPLVLCGEYVGYTKGTKSNRKNIPDFSGEKNPFYGKKHDDKTRRKISEEVKLKNKPKSEEWKKWFTENVAKKTKSQEHRNKISRPGFVALKNINTGETIRIKKEDHDKYDKTIWLNPYAYSCKKGLSKPRKRLICPYCNEEMPAGKKYNKNHGENCKENENKKH